MSRRFRVTANFPILEQNAHQTVIVDGSNWQVALGKASRAFKKLPVMRRRRVTALSMMVEQIGTGDQADTVINEQPAAEQTVMEQPTYTEEEVNEQLNREDAEDVEALNQQANDEAERLITEGEEIEDIEE